MWLTYVWPSTNPFSPHNGVWTVQSTGVFWQAVCLVPTPFFRSWLCQQNFNCALRQYRQLCRLKDWLKLFKNCQLELVEQWDWSLSLIYQCEKCLIHSTLCIKHFSRSVELWSCWSINKPLRVCNWDKVKQSIRAFELAFFKKS